jgi:hypothetical protein
LERPAGVDHDARPDLRELRADIAVAVDGRSGARRALRQGRAESAGSTDRPAMISERRASVARSCAKRPPNTP